VSSSALPRTLASWEAVALAETDVFKHSTPSLYDRYMGPLLFEPYGKHVASRLADLAPTRILETARDAAHGIVLGSPFRTEIERLGASALERATAAVEQALNAWDGAEAPMSAHVVTATR
jgi:hypothetical protein